MTHICVGKLTNIGSDNGLLPRRRQAIIWTNAGILLIGPLGTNFGEILIVIDTFQENALENVVCEMASISFRPQCVKTWINACWNALSKIQISHMNNDNENAFNYTIIITMSPSSFDDGAKSAWSADHWPIIGVRAPVWCSAIHCASHKKPSCILR